MKVKALLWVILFATALTLRATTTVNYSFTLLPGDTLANIYIVDFVPQEETSFFTAISSTSGSITLMGSGSDAQYLSIMANFTDASSNTGACMALPASTAAVVTGSNDTWSQFNTTYALGAPSETSVEADLEAGNLNTLDNAFSDVSGTSLALNTAVYNNTAPLYNPDAVVTGEIVGFDGAEELGSLTITAVPEPSISAAMLTAGFGSLFLFRRRRAIHSPPAFCGFPSMLKKLQLPGRRGGAGKPERKPA